MSYRRVRMVSRGSEKAPAFGGRGALFLDYEHHVHLRMRPARTVACARASVLILQMQPAPRQLCLGDGSDILGRSDGAAKTLEIPRNSFAPGAAGAIRRQVMRYMRLRRADQSIYEKCAEYDLLRRGPGRSEQFVSILRMDNAPLSRHEKSLVMASCHKSLKFAHASETCGDYLISAEM